MYKAKAQERTKAKINQKSMGKKLVIKKKGPQVPILDFLKPQTQTFDFKSSQINQSQISQNSKTSQKPEELTSSLQQIEETVRKRSPKPQMAKISFPQINESYFRQSNELRMSIGTPKETISKQESPEPGRKYSTRYKDITKSLNNIENKTYNIIIKPTEVQSEETSEIITSNTKFSEECQKVQTKELEEIKKSYVEFKIKVESQLQFVKNAVQGVKDTEEKLRVQQSRTNQKSLDCQMITLETDTTKCNNCVANTNKILSILEQVRKFESYADQNFLDVEKISGQNQIMQSIIENQEFYSLNEGSCKCSIF